MCLLEKNRGFSLVELLFAMVITSMIVMAAVSVFTVQSRQASAQEETGDLQMNGQVALDIVSRDIRMAGFGMPVSARGTALKGEVALNASFDDNYVVGTTDPAPNIRAVGTDAITIQYFGNVLANNTPDPTTFRQFRYYVLPIVPNNPAALQGLVRQDLAPGGTTEVIAPNVEDMQIQVNTTSNNPPAAATMGASGTTTRVILNIRVRAFKADPQYRFPGMAGLLPNGNAVAGGDNFRRRVYGTTVNVRNFGLPN